MCGRYCDQIMTKKQCGQVSSHVAAATVLLPPHTADNSCAVSNTYGTRYICVCNTSATLWNTDRDTLPSAVNCNTLLFNG